MIHLVAHITLVCMPSATIHIVGCTGHYGVTCKDIGTRVMLLSHIAPRRTVTVQSIMHQGVQSLYKASCTKAYSHCTKRHALGRTVTAHHVTHCTPHHLPKHTSLTAHHVTHRTPNHLPHTTSLTAHHVTHCTPRHSPHTTSLTAHHVTHRTPHHSPHTTSLTAHYITHRTQHHLPIHTTKEGSHDICRCVLLGCVKMICFVFSCNGTFMLATEREQIFVSTACVVCLDLCCSVHVYAALCRALRLK